MAGRPVTAVSILGSNQTVAWKQEADALVVACNFTPVPRENYKVGVNEPGLYREIFNTDSKYYCGSNLGNGMGVLAKPVGAQGRPYSLSLTLPPVGVVILKRAQE